MLGLVHEPASLGSALLSVSILGRLFSSSLMARQETCPHPYPRSAFSPSIRGVVDDGVAPSWVIRT
jgi:hypothetical protein